MNPAEERFSARFLKRCRCVCCGQQLVDRVGVFLLVDQQMSKSTRVNFPVARGGYVVVYWNAAFWNFACDQQQESLLFVDKISRWLSDQLMVALLTCAMRRRLGNPGSTAGRGFNPAGGAPGGG
ncbi:hypothetical protein F511_20722 [Dorcoceras hygrometricum]|uniref:Uncharacterized protein n=1 Tax=Dorcoceras hygrometricum TaxID=472368 RepID=A0A2Z7ASM1_9LAMI|nr:hypothetical protein F511_20722 [Dorcoceras hygrometricum]